MDLTKELDLELAWNRHKKDIKDLSFADHPYEINIIDFNFNDWIKELKQELQNYHPSRAEIVNIPKKNHHLRPGSILSPEDSTVFHAIILKEINKIRDKLLWSANKYRFSNILKEDQSTVVWFVDEFKGWNNFRLNSLKYIDDGYEWVVFADISAYFENMSIDRLISDLRSLELSFELRNLLISCLYRWAEPRSRGIPQGNIPSFILSEVYLNSIDHRLANNGKIFCRYVDDIRIFCNSKEEAISSLHFLTTLLREKELNLQTAKSYIKEANVAKNEIDRIAKILEKVEQDIKAEFTSNVYFKGNYPSPSAIENMLESSGKDNIEIEAIHKAFDDHINDYSFDFDRSLFHYLINRLGASKDSFAAQFCIQSIKERPEEFQNILDYFSKLGSLKNDLSIKLISELKDQTENQNRQYFLLLRWIYREGLSSEEILENCRRIAFDSSFDDYTRHFAWAILGRFGDLSDLDAIESEYGGNHKEISRATILCAIKNMVADRRNSTYQRAKNDGTFVTFSIKYSKSS